MLIYTRFRMMKLLIFLIIASKFCSIEITSTKMFTSDIDTSIANNFADCILNISRRYFDNTLPVAIQMSSMYHQKYQPNTNENQLLYTLSKENEFSHVTLGLIEDIDNPFVYGFKTGNAMKYSSYLLVLSGNSIRENFDLVFKMMQRIYIGRNEKSKLIIVLTNTLKTLHEQERHAKKLLQVLFKIGFVYSIVIAPNTIHGSNVQQLNIFGWSPNLQNNICSMKISTINLLDTWNFERRAFVLNAELLPEYTYIDMKGCVLLTGIVYYYPFIFPYFPDNKLTMGRSFFEFILILEKLLNCKFRLRSQDMSINIIHVQFPIFINTELQFNDCGRVYPYYSDDYYWYVPFPLEIPRWRSLIRAFKPEMWVFVSLAFIFGTLILFYLQKFSKKRDYKNKSISLADQFLSSMKTYLGISTSVHYGGKIAIATFVLWLFYCLVINTAYQSALFGLIVNPGHYPAIKTLKELDESGLKKVTAYYTNKVDLGGVYGLYYNNYSVCSNSVYSCYKKVTKERLQTVLESSYAGKKAMEEFTEGGLPQIVPVKEKYLTIYIVAEIYCLSCVLHKPMEITLRRLVSAGLIERWNNEFRITEKRRVTLNNETSLVSAFGLSHLYGVFYICILGLMLAFIVFLTEILLPAFYQGFT
ncbi:Ionotropic receptor 528 [Blattella germanica]|nr:Ionotropic receptor 528 [Blattella germanica]